MMSMFIVRGCSAFVLVRLGRRQRVRKKRSDRAGISSKGYQQEPGADRKILQKIPE